MDNIPMFNVLVICLGALLAIGVVTWIIKLVMKPTVLIFVFAALGWVMFAGVSGYI